MFIVFHVKCSDLAVVGQQFFKVFRAENVDLGEEKLALHEGSAGIVQDSPDRNKVLELPSSLLDHAVLAGQHNGHTRQICHLGAAHYERVNVEATGCQDTRDARQDTGLILDKAIEDVSLGGSSGGRRRFVKDIGNGGLGGPGRRGIGDGERSLAAPESFVRDRRG